MAARCIFQMANIERLLRRLVRKIARGASQPGAPLAEYQTEDNARRYIQDKERKNVGRHPGTIKLTATCIRARYKALKKSLGALK